MSVPNTRSLLLCAVIQEPHCGRESHLLGLLQVGPAGRAGSRTVTRSQPESTLQACRAMGDTRALSPRRLPASTTARQRLQVVAEAIDVLGLDDVRHQLIGNEEVRLWTRLRPDHLASAPNPGHAN